jgi:NAD(P)-dependent dehydrogenase (short-subunit alcohol dehydrogenase family)
MSDNRLKKQDPRHQYPNPPFKTHMQDSPGLAVKMSPKPDHGEESYKGNGRLEGRKALITGGDSGIGRAVAIAFAREGADVAINYLPSEEADAKEVVAWIEKAGRKAVAIPGDITNEEFCKSLVEKAVGSLGGLDILVNNAATQRTQPSILEITTEQFDKTMKTNLYAMFWITKAAIPHLTPGSAVINTTSIQAVEPSKPLVDYAITKAGILNFTKSLSKFLIQRGVRVNAVAPGPFWTPLQPSGGQTAEKLAQFGKETLFGRPGQPVELAPVYVLLASQEGSYIAGEVYGVTGGEGVV